ncbi:MAG: RagB/SusD family nutrient uptake outer membrane protein [Capnocytophaga sp.]|nr:RagB/SusD family nutrient uptake outer membrane protein [Capnocytophaga sp.]
MKISYIIVTVLSVFATAGCQKFLDHTQYGQPTSENFWKTEEDAISARNALTNWTAREGIDGRGHMWFENCSDNLVTGRPQAQGDQIKAFKMTASTERDWIQNWPRMYQIIASANDIFRNVPEMEISADVKNNVIAEAHFWRGFSYLWLAPWYGDNSVNGGIPIITELTPVEELDKERPASVIENYDMIIDDMAKAGDLLPLYSQISDADKGRPHKAAAWGFAARAALYAAQYDAKYYDVVLDMTQRIMNLGGADARSLYPDFTTLFSEANNFSSEYIFSMLGNANDGPKFAGMSFQNGGYGLYNTWGYFQPTLELYKAYESGDIRRDATILYPGSSIQFIGRNIFFGVSPREISSTSGMTFRKWMHPFREANAAGTSVNANGNNASTRMGLPILRYADIVLMRAEALIWSRGEGNAEAVSLLNQIRKRAGLPENSAATKDQLKNERRCELAFEFLPSRFVDLVRWKDFDKLQQPLHGVSPQYDTAGNIIGINEVEIFPARVFNPQVNHVFPIPERFRTQGKNLKQNVGY